MKKRKMHVLRIGAFVMILVFLFSGTAFSRVKQPVLSGKERAKMFSSHIKMKAESEFKDLKWQYVGPTILSPHNQDIVYHGMQFVLMSRDKGHTWEYISPDLTYNDPNKQGDISYQTITASRYDLGTVYVTQTGRRDDDFQVYIWKSTDFGETWEDISGNVPVGSVNVIREDPRNRNILYVGTDAGVYISKNAGEKWDVLGDLPFAYVHDLDIQPRDNMIIVATHGRGMWVFNADPLVPQDMRMRFRRE